MSHSSAMPPKAPPAAEVLTIRPAAKMKIPAGYEADLVDVRTSSGVVIPMRTLLPNGMAAK